MKLFDIQPRLFVRNLDAGSLWENFLISAVSSLLGLRFILHITGYPVIGSGNIHIAHMLWGGLLMLIAILLLFLFLNKESRELASVVGGFGFGIFIDELGKFVTSNHDYFFEPTIALIYIIFILLFLLLRISEKYIPVSDKDYAVNALEILKDVITSDLDEQEKRRAIIFLRKSDPQNILIRSINTIMLDIDIEQPGPPSMFAIFKREVRRWYLKIVYHKYFTTGVIIFFVTSSIVTFSQAILSFKSIDSFTDSGYVVSSLLAGGMVLIATYILQRGHRYLAFEMYKYAVLVNIFLTQFFMFYQEQLSALVELAGSITVYIVLRYLISQEIIEHPQGETHLLAYFKRKIGIGSKN